VVARLAGSVAIADVARDGKVLVTDATLRAELMCQPPGETKERPLSWLDISVARGLSDDGRTLLINADGEGGGERFSVYVRRTDGSPAVRLAEGVRGLAISPDAKLVLAVVASPPQLVLLPTGAGEQRALPNDGITEYTAAAWFPDGKRFVFVGTEAGRGGRAYVSGLGGEAPRPVTPEGVDAAVVSPDGRFVAVHGTNVSGIYPVDGGEPRLLPEMGKDDALLQWSLDGRSLYLYKASEMPRRIYRFDIATKRREVWREINPPDAVGNTPLLPVQVTRDGRAYAYTVEVTLSDLYLVDGWK
jgi:hypothetical protein